MDKYLLACSDESPHISADGFRLAHTFGLSGLPNILHLFSSDSCIHRTPKGLPPGMPGIGDEIDTYMQQAAQPDLHSIFSLSLSRCLNQISTTQLPTANTSESTFPVFTRSFPGNFLKQPVEIFNIPETHIRKDFRHLFVGSFQKGTCFRYSQVLEIN